jgi:hypothetical protein
LGLGLALGLGLGLLVLRVRVRVRVRARARARVRVRVGARVRVRVLYVYLLYLPLYLYPSIPLSLYLSMHLYIPGRRSRPPPRRVVRRNPNASHQMASSLKEVRKTRRSPTGGPASWFTSLSVMLQKLVLRSAWFCVLAKPTNRGGWDPLMGPPPPGLPPTTAVGDASDTSSESERTAVDLGLSLACD